MNRERRMSIIHPSAIQFAELSGFGPIITTASLRHRDLLTSFGATHVLDRTLPSENILEEVQAIANGPVDLAFDAVSENDTLQLASAAVRFGGQLVVVLPGSEESIKDVIQEKKIQAVPAVGRMSGVNRGALDGLWEKLPEFLEKGLIKVGGAYFIIDASVAERVLCFIFRLACPLRGSAWGHERGTWRAGAFAEPPGQRSEAGRASPGHGVTCGDRYFVPYLWFSYVGPHFEHVRSLPVA